MKQNEKLLGKQIKLKNRRVNLARFDNGDYAIWFRILDENKAKGERIKDTNLRISKEAMDSLIQLYEFFQPQAYTFFVEKQKWEKVDDDAEI